MSHHLLLYLVLGYLSLWILGYLSLWLKITFKLVEDYLQIKMNKQLFHTLDTFSLIAKLVSTLLSITSQIHYLDEMCPWHHKQNFDVSLMTLWCDISNTIWWDTQYIEEGEQQMNCTCYDHAKEWNYIIKKDSVK